MRSNVLDILPARVKRSLKKFGEDLRIARQKRHLTVSMMAERIGVAKSTYLRAEKGDPKVTLGVYVMALFVLGLSEAFTNLFDPSKDEQGLLLDVARLPKRVRSKRVIGSP